MNQTRDDLAALDRITLLIKRFRQQAGEPKTISKQSIDVFLEKQLSPQDWAFWEQLRMDPDELLEHNQTSLADHALSGQHFTYLLEQYRRAGFEVYQTWYQLQQSSGFSTTDPFQKW